MRLASASLTFLLATVAVAGQIPAPRAAPDIPPEKRALIKELYTVTKAGETAEKLSGAVLDQLGNQLPAMVSQALGDSLELKGKDREEFERSLAESSRRVLARLKELMPQRLNWGETMEQIFYPIYDKHFSEQELKDLIVFYKSPTGQKSIQVMPDLFKEAMQKTSELMNPRMMKLINEVLEEERQRLRKK
jgi:hypothetical protein